MMFIIINVILCWKKAPDYIPVHYDAMGKVNRYGSKAEALIPLIILGIVYGMLTLFQHSPYQDERTGGKVFQLDKKLEKQLLDIFLGMEKLALVLIMGMLIVCTFQSASLPAAFAKMALALVLLPVLFFLCYYLYLWKTKKQPN